MACLFCVITVGSSPIDPSFFRSALSIQDFEDLAILRNPLAVPTADTPLITVEHSSKNSVVIQSTQNVGYLNGVQLLLELPLPKPLEDYDWIVISNPDLKASAYSSLTSILEKTPIDVAVVGPNNCGDTPWWVPRRLSLLNLFAGLLCWFQPIRAMVQKFQRLDPLWHQSSRKSENPLSNTPCSTPQYMVNGCIFAIRRTVLETMFGEIKFPFLYGEELIIAEHLSLTNKLAVITSDWAAIHVGSESIETFRYEFGNRKTDALLAASRRAGFRTLIFLRLRSLRIWSSR